MRQDIHVESSTPAKHAPRKVRASPTIIIAKDLNVVFMFKRKNTIVTGGKNKHPRNQPIPRLNATTRNITFPTRPAIVPIISNMYPKITI
jgi:hypothetical protein